MAMKAINYLWSSICQIVHLKIYFNKMARNLVYQLCLILVCKLLPDFSPCIGKGFFIEILKLIILWLVKTKKEMWFILLILDWLRNTKIVKLAVIYRSDRESLLQEQLDMRVLHLIQVTSKEEKMIFNLQDSCFYISSEGGYLGKEFKQQTKFKNTLKSAG